MRVVVDGLPYAVIVSEAAPQDVSEIAARAGRRAIVICDRNVEPRGALVGQALKNGGCEVLAVAAIAAGERRKHWKTVSELHALLLAAGVDRKTLVVVVGGGTLSDVAGFAAATFMRGVPWLAVPTTVLGMVDAGIGGKTGVDRPEGKNLIGALWDPIAVVSDLAALATLPAREKMTGMAEIVKAAVIGDPALLDEVERFDLNSEPRGWALLVSHAAAVKARVVAKDPLDREGRAVLNLGHTFAHAIEHASKFRVAHGAAVALGLRAAGVLARNRTGWPLADHRRVLRALRRVGLRVHTSRLGPDAILAGMGSDKKRQDGRPRFVLPVRLGEVRHGFEVADDEIRLALATLATPLARDAW